MDVTMCRMTEKPTYSTLQAAKKARKNGIHRATLIRWLQEGRVTTSIAVPLADGKILRRWTDADIRKLQAYCDDFYRVPNEIRDKK
jgi:predicted DNA-binding protein (UPF0251 family)